MDNSSNKRLKKENLSTERRSPPVPSSVNIFLFIINSVFLIYF